jgi:hypothetical protein
MTFLPTKPYFQRADFGRLRTARTAFDVLETHDFEVVMRALRLIVQLLPIYHDAPDLIARLTADADGLREVLVQAIAQTHPAGPFEIEEAQYAACRQFLANFDKIYTLNYDLLLYWVLMHTETDPQIRCDDGFRKPDDPDADYVTWEVSSTPNQNIFYLHGALHLFDAGFELQKYTWINRGVRLIEQIREALRNNLYPLIVAEGESHDKDARILHSGYLTRGARSFVQIQNNLFIFGHSFGGSDQHWFNLIVKGKINRLFVSLYGDPESAANRLIRGKASGLSDLRSPRRPLEVLFYDAPSAHVWG